MRILHEHAKYEIFLVDDGTLDTVIRVRRLRDHEDHEERFDQEYAAGFRKRNGEMTRKGLRQLGVEAVDAWLDQIALDEMEEEEKGKAEDRKPGWERYGV